jgi:putative oxidoreductase
MKITCEFDLRTALRWLLAALLVWAALSKIANPQEFHGDLAAYQLPLPDALVRLAAMVLPWLELLCGISLVAGTARRAALLWTIILFGVFVLATGQAWARGLEISCGCFKLDFLGAGAAKLFESVKFAFFRALLLLAAAIYVWREAPPRRAVPGPAS